MSGRHNDRVVAALRVTQGYQSELSITFADLSDLTIKEAWECLQFSLSLSAPALLLKEMGTRGVQFKDCTVVEASDSLLRPNRWGLSNKNYLLLKRRGIFSMRIVQAMSDAELRDLRNVGKKTVDEIRASQAIYERGDQ